MKKLAVIFCFSISLLSVIAQEKFSVPVMTDQEKINGLASSWNTLNLYLISHGKSMGKSIVEIATYTSDLYISGMDKSVGFDGYAKLLIQGWVGTAPNGKVEIREQTGDRIVISVSNFCSQLKEKGTMYNVSYQEYIKYLECRGNRVFGVLGGTYSIKDSVDGLIITMQKK
jgi:hypothetical protein